jgi:hypothetical protein
MKPIKCWHFLQDDRRLRWGTKEVVEVGQTYTVDFPYEFDGGGFKEIYDKPALCKAGVHGSRRILDALQYAPGPICCRVKIWGEVIAGKDKLVGRSRKVLQMIDATDILRKFARLCALDIIHLWDAPDVVVEYLKTGNEAIREAAWDAVNAADAARYATDAAMAAAGAARYAADAARDAVNAARYAADAARYAVNAARYAAGASRYAADVAWDAAWDKQNRRLTALIVRAMKESK